VTRVEIKAGVCGFTTLVEVERIGGELRVSVSSGCSMVTRLGERLGPLRPIHAAARILENPVHRAADGCIAHPACPVVAGILKAIEVETGVAVPEDSWIRFREA